MKSLRAISAAVAAWITVLPASTVLAVVDYDGPPSQPPPPPPPSWYSHWWVWAIGVVCLVLIIAFSRLERDPDINA